MVGFAEALQQFLRGEGLAGMEVTRMLGGAAWLAPGDRDTCAAASGLAQFGDCATNVDSTSGGAGFHDETCRQ